MLADSCERAGEELLPCWQSVASGLAEHCKRGGLSVSTCIQHFDLQVPNQPPRVWHAAVGCLLFLLTWRGNVLAHRVAPYKPASLAVLLTSAVEGSWAEELQGALATCVVTCIVARMKG